MPNTDYYSQQLMAGRPIAAQNMGMVNPDPMQAYLQKNKQTQDLIDASASSNKSPTSFLDGLSDKEQFLLEMGMQMMASGSRPGASLLGSLGEGAMSATKGTRQRKKDAYEVKRQEDAQRLQELLASTTLSKNAADTQMGYDKFGYQQSQDAITNSQRDRAFGLDENRFAQQQYQFENPDGQIIQDGDGNFILAPKRGGGPAMPLTDAQGNPIAGQNPTLKILQGLKMKSAADSAAQGYSPKEIRSNMESLDQALGMTPTPAAQPPSSNSGGMGSGGGGTAPLDPTQIFIQNAKAKGATDEQIQNLLKKFQKKGK